jgi:tetratricopeptide (TPR) repeat protein
MKPVRTLAAIALLAALGSALAASAAKKNAVEPAVYRGQDPARAAEGLLALARGQAGDGTWERIAVGRVLYVMGKKAEGQAIFDEVLAGRKVEAPDWMRVARVYQEAGEWDKARPLFDKVLAASPKDEDWHAEVGAYYLLHGDRAKAEELFARSFELDPENLYNTLRVASAYAGLPPKE